uniref:Uncharacterized protein n=1 Tax=Lactuca sativa TaxID=4236 RepID=A0A9R1UWB6_LACSA|nr:hypothetical protein LSAT_V11C800415110 [Lactuca sativa]
MKIAQKRPDKESWFAFSFPEQFTSQIHVFLHMFMLSLVDMLFELSLLIQKKVNALRELRRLLSKSEYPPVETALLENLKKQELNCLHYLYSLLKLEVTLGNVAGEGEEPRQILISQGALLPLAKMMLPNKVSTVRTAAW